MKDTKMEPDSCYQLERTEHLKSVQRNSAGNIYMGQGQSEKGFRFKNKYFFSSRDS